MHTANVRTGFYSCLFFIQFIRFSLLSSVYPFFDIFIEKNWIIGYLTWNDFIFMYKKCQREKLNSSSNHRTFFCFWTVSVSFKITSFICLYIYTFASRSFIFPSHACVYLFFNLFDIYANARYAQIHKNGNKEKSIKRAKNCEYKRGREREKYI